MGQAAPTQLKNPETLGQFNGYLNELGFSPITRESLEKIFQTEPRERIVKALNMADRDQGALAYLNNVLSICNGGQQAETPPVAPQTPAEEPWRQGQNSRPQNRSDAPSTSSQRPTPAPQHSYSGSRQAPASTSAPRTTAPETSGSDGEREYLQKHVYGGKAALCFEADETRKGVHTVCLDAAASTAPREYDWNNKIRVQFTRDELLVVTAVFFGLLPSCKYDSHGEGKDKGFSIEDQGKNLFIKVFAKGAARAVPVTPEDAYYVSAILMRQLRKNSPWMSCSDILQMIARVVAARKNGN